MNKIPNHKEKNTKSVYLQDKKKRLLEKRQCLGPCGLIFLSWGKQNRLCQNCAGKFKYSGLDLD